MMMLSLKPEVRFHFPLQALAIIALAVTKAFENSGYDTVITSSSDGTHKVGSLHYRGLALDFRMKHVANSHKAPLVEAIKAALPQCDVLHEGFGTPSEHLHCEWDPDHDNAKGL